MWEDDGMWGGLKAVSVLIRMSGVSLNAVSVLMRMSGVSLSLIFPSIIILFNASNLQYFFRMNKKLQHCALRRPVCDGCCDTNS